MTGRDLFLSSDSDASLNEEEVDRLKLQFADFSACRLLCKGSEGELRVRVERRGAGGDVDGDISGQLGTASAHGKTRRPLDVCRNCTPSSFR